MSDYFGSRGSFRSRAPREDVDPMTSMSGIGDVMLVFACGLMVALVVAWNVNLSEFTEVEVGEEIEDVQQMEEQMSGGAGYIERGYVYQDPSTGQYYLVDQKIGEGDNVGNDNAAAEGNAADTAENGGE